MALPVAPLGQLPSMNMPYSRPYYEKSSAVDKALASFLTGMMASIGSQAAENAMQRDFAAEPAGFWSKLTQGPKQNRQQFEAQTARTAEEAALQKQLSSREQIAEADRLQRAGEVDRRFEDSQRDREARMALSERELQQRSEQARYLAEQQRMRDEFLAGNRLTEIDREATARGRLSGQAAADERAMREALLNAEYGWKRKLAEEDAARWRIGGLGAQVEQPGQSAPQGRRQLSASEEAAMRAAGQQKAAPTDTREQMRNSWLARMTTPTNYFKGNVPVLPTAEEVMASGQPAPVVPSVQTPPPVATPTVPVEQPSIPTRSIESEYLYDPLSSIFEWIRADAHNTDPVQLSPATLDALRRQSRP